MTIKTKLTANIMIVLIIIIAVVATSVVSMRFIKDKLYYLTERSTPFQIRTIEFQRSLQGALAGLVAVSAAQTVAELNVGKADAEKSMSVVKSSQDAITSISGETKVDAYSELKNTSAELITMTENRLKSETEVVASSAAIVQRLKDFAERMKTLETHILALQTQRLGNFAALLEEAKEIDTVRDNPAVSQLNVQSKVMLSNSKLTNLGLTINSCAISVMSATTPKELNAQSAELNRIFNGSSKSFIELNNLLKMLKANEEIKTVKVVQDSLNMTRQLLGKLIEKRQQHMQILEKSIQIHTTLKEIALKQTEKSKTTVTASQGEQEKAITSVNTLVRNSTLLIICIGIGAILLGISFGIWIYRSIAKPLNNLINVSTGVANGDLASKIIVNSTDEIGKVQSSMVSMVSNLQDIVGKIKGATDGLANSSEELSATAVALEKGSNEQSSQIELSVTAMTQMAQTTNEVAKNTSDTSEAAMKMKEIAEHGKEAMNITVQELNKFAATVKETAGKIEALGEQSQAISTVVTLINDIADQTNLLALNAAIEAARAGDQGRGFAVVADSVRQLAVRTTEATSEIAQTVKIMQSSVNESVGLMQDERESVERVLNHVTKTLGSIDDIVVYVGKVTEMVQQIAVASEQQSSSTYEVSENMDRIATITKELRNAFEDIKQSSGGLSLLANDLNTTVRWFKV